MPIEFRAILDFFRDAIGRIMIILGASFIFIALLHLNRVYQWVSSLSLLLGVTLIIIGTALHNESFKWKVPSIDGVGTILIYVSPVFMTAAVVALIFATPTGEGLILPPYYGSPDDSPFPVFIPPTYTPGHYGQPRSGLSPGSDVCMAMVLGRPYAWLAAPLVLTGLGLLAFGFLLKFVRDNF